MAELMISLSPDLLEPASMRPLKGTLDIDSYTVGGMKLETPTGVCYDVQLTNTGEGILLQGTAACNATTECARCLDPATLKVEGQVENYYLLEPAEELDEYEADEFECVNPEGTIDIAPAIMAALVHETPYVVLCAEECAGLCPTCGANLNEGPCGCDDEPEVDPANPFAALKDFKFEDEAGE